MNNEPCPKCGKNLVMVGKAHNCVPRGPVVTPMFSKKASAVTRAVVRKTVQATERAAVKSGEPPASATELEAKVLKLPRSVWGRIDDYWHQEKLASRTAAIRALLEKGLP